MNPSLPKRFGAFALIVSGAFAGAAHAQSSYRMAVLEPASDRGLDVGTLGQWGIDATGQVVTTVQHSAGYTFGITNSFTPGWIPLYRSYPTRWPAGTAASVAPVKLSTSFTLMEQASPSGQKLVLRGNATGYALYDTVTKKTLSLGSLVPNSSTSAAIIAGVNNAGTTLVNVLGTVAGEPQTLRHAKMWTPGQGLKALPEGGYLGAVTTGINAAGLVVGAVTTAPTQLHQAALWVNGQLQVIPQATNTASIAFQPNDKGQFLVRRSTMSGSCATSPSSYSSCATVDSTVYLREGSAEKALLAPGDARYISRALLSNAGVVVGRHEAIYGPNVPDAYAESVLSRGEGGSAFIWQAGVFSDLTTWVRAKGVTLPAGGVLTDVLAINDQGSMVVQMTTTPKLTYTILRLVAVP